MRTIKDPTEVIICFGTSAVGQKNTDQPVLPSLAKTLVGIYQLQEWVPIERNLCTVVKEETKVSFLGSVKAY